LMLELVEQAFGDGVVAALAMPLRLNLASHRIDTARIAAADMQPEGHTIEAGDDVVLCLDAPLQILHRVFATSAHPIERDLIDIRREARCIDVDVLAA